MVCKLTSTESRCAGETLPGMIIGIGIAVLLLGSLAVVYLTTTRAFASLADVTDLDSASRTAMDIIGRDIRQADRVAANSSTGMTLQWGTNQIIFAWSPDKKILTRRVGAAPVRPLLRNCDLARFELFQRNLTNGSYGFYPSAMATNAKVVQVTLGCSRSIIGAKSGASGFQSAKIVIRKQK